LRPFDLLRIGHDGARSRRAAKLIRVVDKAVAPGVTSDERDGDEWPEIHQELLAAEILIVATPTWLGRMDAMISETDAAGRPVAYNRVAGVVVTGNEDGAHHVISEVAGALLDIGYTIPGQALTYWNKGPGPGPDYSETDEGHEWSRETGEAAANLLAVARALAATPMPAPRDAGP
jgi:multimeric flavodoxin WrbA